MSRLDEIQERAAALPFPGDGWKFVAGNRVPDWLLHADILNDVQALTTVDIPYLLAEVRRLRAALTEIALGGPMEGAQTETEFVENVLAGEG